MTRTADPTFGRVTGWGAGTGPPLPPPPPRSGRSRRELVRTIGIGAFSVLWIALRIVLLVVVRPDARPATGTPPPARQGAFVRTLPAGTCLIQAYPADYVTPTPCTERHGSELVALLAYPGPPGGAYPPVQESFRVALDLCEKAFNAYVGGTADQTPARFFVALPSLGEWRGGERLVVCFANGRNGVELATSVRAR